MLNSHLADGQRVEQFSHGVQRQNGLSVRFVQTTGQFGQHLEKQTVRISTLMTNTAHATEVLESFSYFIVGYAC